MRAGVVEYAYETTVCATVVSLGQSAASRPTTFALNPAVEGARAWRTARAFAELASLAGRVIASNPTLLRHAVPTRAPATAAASLGAVSASMDLAPRTALALSCRPVPRVAVAMGAASLMESATATPGSKALPAHGCNAPPPAAMASHARAAAPVEAGATSSASAAVRWVSVAARASGRSAAGLQTHAITGAQDTEAASTMVGVETAAAAVVCAEARSSTAGVALHVNASKRLEGVSTAAPAMARASPHAVIQTMAPARAVSGTRAPTVRVRSTARRVATDVAGASTAGASATLAGKAPPARRRAASPTAPVTASACRLSASSAAQSACACALQDGLGWGVIYGGRTAQTAAACTATACAGAASAAMDLWAARARSALGWRHWLGSTLQSLPSRAALMCAAATAPAIGVAPTAPSSAYAFMGTGVRAALGAVGRGGRR